MKVIPVSSTLTGSFEDPARLFKGNLSPKQDAIYEGDAVEDFRQDDEEDNRYQEEEKDDRHLQLSDIMRRKGHFRDQQEGHNNNNRLPERRYTDLDVRVEDSSSAEENLEVFYKKRTPSKPVAAKTFPPGGSRGKNGNGRPAYPKEKWVAPPPSLLRVEESGVGLESFESDSADDFLKSCEENGKYQIDKTSLLDSKLQSQEDEPRYNESRYNESRYAVPARVDSSDDDVAMWRSFDEDSEDSEDWDTAMPMAMPRSKSKVAVMQQVSYDDEDTLESFEMMSFDPKNVQTLTSEHKLSQNTKEVASFPNGLVDKPSKKLEKKLKKRQKQKERRDTRNTLKEIKRARSRSKERAPKSPAKKGMSLSKLRTMQSISSTNTWEDYSDQDADRSSRGRDRLRNVVEDSRDDISYSSTSSLDTQERKAFREQHREEHRRWLKHRKEGKPYPKLSPSRDSQIEEVSDASESSQSVDSEEHRRFRNQKRAEHRRWLAEKRKRERRGGGGGGGDASDAEYTSDEEKGQGLPRSNSKSSRSEGKFRVVRKASPAKGVRGFIGGLFQRKKPERKHRDIEDIMAIYDAKVYSNDESEEEPPPDDSALPWEKQKKQGLLQQVVASIRPSTNKNMRTVEDLPFPRSDSYDTSLVDHRDKYADDLINSLPALVVDSDDGLTNSLPALVVGSDYEVEAEAVGPLAAASSNEFSTDSSTAKKKTLGRAKKGLGGTLKNLLHKKAF